MWGGLLRKRYGKDFKIEASLDGKQWNLLEKVKDNREKINQFRFKGVRTRYIRLKGRKRATDWGYSLFEFEVYGEPGQLD